MTTTKTIINFLKMFSTDELHSSVLNLWTKLRYPIHKKHLMLDKMSLITILIAAIKGRGLEEIEARLNLLYCELHPDRSNWRAISITTSSDSVLLTNKSSQKVLSAYLLQKRLLCALCSDTYENKIWIYLKPLSGPNSFTIFLILYPGNNIVLHSEIPSDLKELIFKGVARIYDSKEFIEVPAVSDNIEELLHIALQYRPTQAGLSRTLFEPSYISSQTSTTQYWSSSNQPPEKEVISTQTNLSFHIPDLEEEIVGDCHIEVGGANIKRGLRKYLDCDIDATPFSSMLKE